MTIHTPAPWTDDTGPLLGADGRQVGEPEPGVDLLAQYPRIMADKALIRTAPEMAAALADLLEWCERTGGWEASCWERARETLRRAEGAA